MFGPFSKDGTGTQVPELLSFPITVWHRPCFSIPASSGSLVSSGLEVWAQCASCVNLSIQPYLKRFWSMLADSMWKGLVVIPWEPFKANSHFIPNWKHLVCPDPFSQFIMPLLLQVYLLGHLWLLHKPTRTYNLDVCAVTPYLFHQRVWKSWFERATSVRLPGGNAAYAFACVPDGGVHP